MNDRELSQELGWLRETIRRIESRVGALERQHSTEGRREAPVEARADTRATYSTLARVLFNLFADETGERVKALRGVLLSDAPDAKEQLRSLLASLNQVDGEPVDPRLNDTQLDGLRKLLTAPTYKAISPIGNPAGSPPDRIYREALTFWRELLSKQPDEVHAFHRLITQYADNRADSSRLAALLARLYGFAPQGEWSRQHADALAVMNRDQIEFKSLKWFPYPEDGW
jgi:hypothetical protein